MHISGWYNRVQVSRGDFQGAARELAIDLATCNDKGEAKSPDAASVAGDTVPNFDQLEEDSPPPDSGKEYLLMTLQVKGESNEMPFLSPIVVGAYHGATGLEDCEAATAATAKKSGHRAWCKLSK